MSDGLLKIKNGLKEQILEMDEYPWYSCEIRFDKNLLPMGNGLSKWFLDLVKQTNRLMKNKLRESFLNDQFYCFVVNGSGEVEDQGVLSIKILISPIPDQSVEEPNRKCRRLLSKPGRNYLPIENSTYSDIEDYKVDLINACLNTTEWSERYTPYISIQVLTDRGDLEEMVDSYLDSYSDSIDLLTGVDFKSSDFYTP